MSFQRMLYKMSGARAVPAATAYAGRHDPRLHQDEPPPSPDQSPSDEQTAEVSGS